MTQQNLPRPGPASHVVSPNRSEQTSETRPVKAPAVPAKLKQGKPSLEERLPAGVYADRPTAGFSKLHWLLFWGYVQLRLYKVKAIPAPSVSTREIIVRLKLGIMSDAEAVQLKTATVNQKGGAGKTPVATAVAALLAWVTQQFVLLVDANQTKGNTASRIGVSLTMAIREAVSFFEKTGAVSHEVAVRIFGRHPNAGYGSLRVINSNTHDERKIKLGYERITRFFHGIKPAVHSMVFDCGNTTDGAPTRASIAFADVPMFVARPLQENSLTDCRDTIDHYRDECPDKVKNGVVVIVDHRRYRLRRGRNSTVRDYAEYFEFPAEQVVLIPHDSFYPVKQLGSMENPDELIKVIMAEKLRPKTVMAYLLLIRILFTLQRKADQQNGKTAYVPRFDMSSEGVTVSNLGDDDSADLLDPLDVPEHLFDDDATRLSFEPNERPAPSTADRVKQLITTSTVGTNSDPTERSET